MTLSPQSLLRSKSSLKSVTKKKIEQPTIRLFLQTYLSSQIILCYQVHCKIHEFNFFSHQTIFIPRILPSKKMKYSTTTKTNSVCMWDYLDTWKVGVQFITADIFSPTPPILIHSATTTMLLLLFPYGYRRGKFLQTSLNNLMKCMAAYVSNEEYYSIA